ncbi:MAG: DUF58 domain-containing protein [Myxococcota bacterium]
MGFVPGRPLVALAIVPVALGLASRWDRSLLWPMLILDVVIVLVAVVDALSVRRPRVTISRETRPVFSVGQPNPVTLTIRSTARRTLRVTVKDDVFDEATVRDLPIEVRLGPGERAVRRYHVTPHRRGAHQLGAHWARYRSPLGLWIRQLRIDAEQTVRVYPNVGAIRTFELLAKSNRDAAMIRALRRRGGESEFERLREYNRADEYRAIDWKATARRRTLISRTYQLETNQSVLFVLDGGRLMTGESDGLSLFDHALDATLMLSHIAAKNGDHVGLMAFADEVRRFSPPQSGRRAAQRIVASSYDLIPEMVETRFDLAFEHLGTRLRKRSLVVVFTQVQDDAAAAALARMMCGLLPRHLPLAVLMRDVDVDHLLAAPTTPDGGALDGYVRGAAAEAATWKGRQARFLKQRGVLMLDAAPRDLTPALINRYLEIKARHLL